MRVKGIKSVLPVVIAIGIIGCSDNDNDYVPPSPPVAQAEINTKHLVIIDVDGFKFKDMNKNGQLDVYEDWRLSASKRADDLVQQMSSEHKAGIMMHGTVELKDVADPTGKVKRVDLDKAKSVIQDSLVNTFITRMAGNPAYISADNNGLQELAEQAPLAIPIIISTDPRNHFTNDPEATSIVAGSFSQWPETLAFGALDDSQVMKEFGDIARQEYRAVGIQMALSPQSDLATEPRWGRINGTFGEDNQVAKRMTQSYIEGFQNGMSGLNKDSVITVVKHFSGGGPELNGLDSHSTFGKEQVYPGDNFEYHLVPFEGAFAANVAAVMPYYSVPKAYDYKDPATGKVERLEEVGFGFNKQVLDGMLRGRFGFNGMILSDWGIISTCGDICVNGLTDEQIAESVSAFTGFGTPWGVENYSQKDRIIKAVDAGIDQFGGVSDPTALLNAINGSSISMDRINLAVKRILVQKFELGLFENPYVDEAAAVSIVGNSDFQAKADDVQRRAHVLLKNDNLLPLATDALKDKKVYLHKTNAEVATSHGAIPVTDMDDAELIIIRTETPYQTTPRFAFGHIHFGQLGFESDDLVELDTNLVGNYTGSVDYELIKSANEKNVPVIISVYMDRPAILTNINEMANVQAIFANFGSSDVAFFDILLGKTKPEGKLPFQLPSTWTSVIDQQEDVAKDSQNSLFEFGYGLGY